MRPRQKRPVNVPSILAWGAVVFSLLAVAFIVGSPFGYRAGYVDLRTALIQMVPAGILCGLAGVLVTAVRWLVAWRTRRTEGRWLARLALLVALGIIAVPLSAIQKGARLPRIHDITTDTEDPPQFVDIAPIRADAPNSDVYPGAEVATKQKTAYPDIVPIILPVAPDEAFARSRAAAIKLGWQIIADVPQQGRLEASATTHWYHFVDDIVVRVQLHPEGSRIDVRSVSRVGEGDLGTNAARIRAFRAALG